jgi:hypothetical protein
MGLNFSANGRTSQNRWHDVFSLFSAAFCDINPQENWIDPPLASLLIPVFPIPASHTSKCFLTFLCSFLWYNGWHDASLLMF